MQYYDPKTDVVFKKVFGEHKNLAISLLNAVLQLDGKKRIKDLEYLPSEILPIMGGKRSSAVDVRCQDSYGDYFIVEMQMYWSSDFLRRVLYNCAKVYATLYNKGEEHYKVKRVFSVNILNDVCDNDTANNYHRFNMSEIGNPKRVIEGIEILCIELPKFKPEDYAQRKMLKLWQEFLTSINAKTGKETVTDELMSNAEVKEALDLCRNLTDEERGYYDGFWGMEFLRNDRDKTVREVSLAEGRAEGRAEGCAEGEKQKSIETARMMKADGESIDKIMR
ncbi:MAG: Rpn family recombination-promoting nuclease/putative transposase [Bacteroidales bacterium]|nr:Rpn family recombination-promoting nuclease/putative transposase [Bacteroidales bacterium]